MVFRVEGEFDRGAADRRGDGAPDGWPGDAALAVVDRSKKPTKTKNLFDHASKTKSHTGWSKRLFGTRIADFTHSAQSFAAAFSS